MYTVQEFVALKAVTNYEFYFDLWETQVEHIPKGSGKLTQRINISECYHLPTPVISLGL